MDIGLHQLDLKASPSAIAHALRIRIASPPDIVNSLFYVAVFRTLVKQPLTR